MRNPYSYILKIEKKKFTQAQVAMQNAYIQLLREKKSNYVTVKELCSRAYVARSTFYAYYQNTDEVLEDIENELIFTLAHQNNEIMSKQITEKDDLEFYSETLNFVEKNRIRFHTLLIALPDYRFINKWKAAIKYHFWERLYHEKSDAKMGLVLDIVASSVISAYSYWLNNPYETNIEEIYTLVVGMLKTLDDGV